jgi:hypothetical protein
MLNCLSFSVSIFNCLLCGTGIWDSYTRKGFPHSKLLEIFTIKQRKVARCCNPSYSGGRDQEDHDSKPSPGK